MTDQAGSFDWVSDYITKGKEVALKGTGKEGQEAVDVGGGAVIGSVFGPVGALVGGFIGYMVFEGFKD